MASLGVLERLMMDVLWDARGPLTANELRDGLLDPTVTVAKPLATTTVLTVLSRLEAKGVVRRNRSSRPHGWEPVSTRAEFTASMMHAALESAPDRDAALARFVSTVSAREAETLRSLLKTAGPTTI